MSKRLELVVFISAAVGMILELVGSRVLAPFFGNSLFVWTGLIGVILGSMSLGYYLGGKLADKSIDMRYLSRILLIACGFVLLTAFFKEKVLTLIVSVTDLEVSKASLIAILALFAPASIALGCVSPYAANIKIKSNPKTGSAIGNLYALSTLGSICGTFLAGYVLIPAIGNTNLLFLLAAVLFGLSLLSYFRMSRSVIVTMIVGGLFFYLSYGYGLFRLNVLADIDSLYNRILVRDVVYKDKKTTALSIENFGTQSAVYPGSPDELVSDYTNAYRIAGLLVKKIDKALMLGGAGFTFPRYYLKNNLGNTIDVVEIDPKMVDVAKKYFFLKDDPRLKIYLEDARTYLKKTETKYDVVYFDAFSSINPPYHLTTVEYLTEIRNHLSDNGVVMINIISSTKGEKSQFLNAEGTTLKQVFGKIDLFLIQDKSSDQVQNLMLVAYIGDRPKEIKTDDQLLKRMVRDRFYLENMVSGKLVLTDDYAPVDFISRSLYQRSN